MDRFDDEEEVFDNKIKTVDDILDNPILTTSRRDTYNAVVAAAHHASRVKQAYQVGESYSSRAIRPEIEKRIKEEFSVNRLSHLQHSAIDLCQQHDLSIKDIHLLPIEFRFDVLADFSVHSDEFTAHLKENLARATAIYHRARDGIRIQLGGDLSPLTDLRPFNSRALSKYKIYARADATFEKVIHARQEAGLEDRSGLVCLTKEGRFTKLLVAGEVVVLESDTAFLVTSWDDFLCWRSMAIYRRNAFLLCAIDPNLPPKLETSLSALLDWQERCVLDYGNEGYELAKATESVFKARLMQIADGPLDGDAYSMMILKQKEKERGIRRRKGMEQSTTPLMDKLHSFSRSVRDTREAAELFGSLKFSGHPYIDPRLASCSSREHGTDPGNPSFIEAMKMRAEFCDMILRGYIGKWGRWPSLSFSPGSNTKLERLFKKKTLNYPPGSYPFTDWYFTLFPKFLDFDYCIDFLDLMDDKSTGLDPQDAWKAWDELKNENFAESKIPDSRSKKLIIRILSMEEFDPVKICNEIRCADLSMRDLSMALYPKEREFKLEARLFVMLEFSVRVFLTLAEKNFKRLMKDYLPEQSMTKGRKGTMQYLESLSLGSRSDDVDTCFIEIDLTRWNLLWRGVVVNPVSRVADDIFGLNGAFSRGHEIFQRSTVVVRVPSELPAGVTANSMPSDWPESEYVWRNHVGGFEGIIQGQWTACTQAEIKLIMRDQDLISYKLLGQGDNQILAVTYRRDHTLSPQQQALQKSRVITEDLERRFKLLNQIVKPDECLVSRNVVTYSKICFVQGYQTPTTLKHAGTVAPVGTSSLPSLVIGLSAISSGCRASADSFSDPSIAYLFFLILFRDYLHRASKTLPCKDRISTYRLTPPLLDLACLIPGDLGGLPIQVPTDFVYGGCSDRLSASVASLVANSHTDKRLKWYLGFLDTSHPWKADPNPTSLLEDPFAVPVETCIGADVRVDSAMRVVIPQCTNNRLVKQVMSSEVGEFETQLKTSLANMRPFYPLLMADAVELSICGVRKKIFKKFTGTRTIQQLIRRRAPINYADAIFSADHQRIQRLISFIDKSERIKMKSKFMSTTIFDRVESYRARWYPDESGVVQGVTTVHPYEARVDVDLKESSSNFIEFTSISDWKTMTTKPGIHAGRWGDKTWEHRRVNGVEVLGKQKAALAAKRLLLLESQLSAAGDLKKILRGVLRQRTSCDSDLLQEKMPTIDGGVGAHRWDSMTEEKAFAWLGPISTTQHVAVQTDTMSSLTGGEVDYSFCFQEQVFFGLQCMRASGVPFEQNPAIRLHYTLHDDQIIHNEPVKCSKYEIRKFPTNLDGNPLVCASEILFQALSEEMPPAIAPLTTLPKACSQDVGTRLMVHNFLDQLEDPALSEAVIQSKEIPAGLSIDVGSLIGIGLKAMIKSAGIACFLRALEMVYSETCHMDRVVFNVYVDKLSLVAAGPLSRFANTPKVRCQQWVRKSGILIAPGKHGGRVLRSRISALIREEAATCLANAYRFDKYKIILSSYVERATPSKVLGCYLALLLFLMNPSCVEVGRALYRKHLSVVRASEVEKDRIAHQVELVQLLASPEFEGVSLIARDLLEGRILRRVSNGLDETKRYLRSGPASEPPKRDCVLVSPPKGRFIAGVPFGDSTIPTLRAPRFPLNRRLDSQLLIKRNLGWRWGGSSISRISLQILSSLTSELLQGETVCIGVGNGAMARDALALGARSLVGVDLQSDLPQLSSLGSAYLPPELPVTDPPLPWKWSKSVFTCGGNWFDPRVQADVLSTQPSVIIMDIQPGERMIWEDILPIVSSGISTTIVTRRTLTEGELPGFLSVARGTFKASRCWVSPINPTEFWFTFKTSGTTSFQRSEHLSDRSLPAVPLLDYSPSDIFYPLQSEYLSSVVLKGRGIPNARLSESVDYLLNYFRRDQTDATRDATEDISLAAFSASVLTSMMTRHDWTEASLIDHLSLIATSSAPKTIHGVRIATIRASEIFNHFSRVIPRVLTLTKGSVSAF